MVKTRCHYGFLRFPTSECLENFLWAQTEFHDGFQLFFFTTINNRPINHNYKSINREKSIDRPTNTRGSFLEVTIQVESLKSIFCHFVEPTVENISKLYCGSIRCAHLRRKRHERETKPPHLSINPAAGTYPANTWRGAH